MVFVLPGLIAGGSERIVSGLANHWASIGGKVSIVTFEPPGTEPYYPIDERVELVQLGVQATARPLLVSMWQVARRIHALRNALKRIRPDVVVSFLTKINVVSVAAAAGLDIPVIVSERNNPEAQRFNAVWNWARKKAYPHAFGLITMTEGAGRFFPAHMRKRSWVIPNPVRLPEEWTPQRGGNNLVAVGRLVDQKGFDLLLEAFSRIAPSFPHWTLTIRGEGPLRKELEELRDKLDLAERVRMPGVTERPGIWVETADIFVLSSRYEGWGIVLLEAMAAGLPVVSFNCEWGPSDMITDGIDGLLVPALDVDALADALEKLMGDAELRERLAREAVRSAAKFAPDRINELWREAVQTAIDGGNTKAPSGGVRAT